MGVRDEAQTRASRRVVGTPNFNNKRGVRGIPHAGGVAPQVSRKNDGELMDGIGVDALGLVLRV